jgi:large repetitive protein
MIRIIASTLVILFALPALGQDHVRRTAPPSGSPGPRNKVRRTAPKSPGQTWRVRKSPMVLGFEPKTGAPGTFVTIKGDHFGPRTRVRFNGRWIKIASFSKVQLTVKLPSGAITDRFVISKPGFPDVVTAASFAVNRPPALDKFMPARGDPGVFISIYGRHFLPTDQVMIGNLPLRIKTIQATRIVAQVPHAARSARLGIRRGKKIVAWSRRIFSVSLPAPVITGFSPRSGERGTVVRITGSNFNAGDFVTIGRKPLAIRKRGPNFFEVLVGKQRSGPFIVRGPGGRFNQSRGAFIVLRAPIVKRVKPSSGSPGTRITIRGFGFASGDAVTLGQSMLTIRQVTPKRILAELPAGVDSGQLFIRRGQKNYPARAYFTVIHPPEITTILPSAAPPGSTITINGAHFAPGSIPMLAGKKLRKIRQTAIQIVAKLPANARSGRIVVISRGGSATFSKIFSIMPYASLRTFFPLSGLPGTQLTVTGANFHPSMAVFLGKLRLRITRRTPNTLQVVIPPGATSGRITIDSHGQRITSRLAFSVLKPQPELSFTVAPTAARRGSEVTLNLTPARLGTAVYYNGRLLPKKVLNNGRTMIVTIPGDARSGYFEVEYKGRRYRSPGRFIVR